MAKRGTRKSKKEYVDFEEKGPDYKKKFTVKDMNSIHAMTENQQHLIDVWEDEPERSFLMFGSAGTGKTFLAFYLGLLDLLQEDSPYEKIIVIRSAAQGRDIGFLPGSEEEKMAQYERPYIQICDQLFKYAKSYENLKKIGKIEFECTSFLRGQTFNNAIIIVDEMQNMNKQETHTILSRVGTDSKMFICGDVRQCDLHKKGDDSGFEDLLAIAGNMKGFFELIEYTREDIVRSGFCKAYVIAKEDLGL